MISITPTTKAFLCLEPIDLRKGIDGLQAVCKGLMQQDPFGGAIFLFRNKSRTSIRLLTYDGQGFWMCTKRLSNGRFNWWPSKGESKITTSIRACDLQTILWNGYPDRADFAEDWRKVS
jgi:transposase